MDSSKRFIKIAAIIFAAFISTNASAAEMADKMRSDGKIWVVVTVLAIILAGLFVYLFTIDRKITSVEKQLNQDKKQ